VADTPREYLVYADGSCIGNPGPGGWGVVIVSPEGKHRLSGGDSRTTNNRMEIMAAIEALRALDPGIPVILRSDSQYLVKTVNDGWRRSKNQDLWKELDAEIARHEVRFEWVRGHAGDALNEEADALAREGARNAALGRAPATPAEPEGDADARLLEKLDPLLDAGEQVRRCAECGRRFVARDGENCCSLIDCQLARRS
jgi:ribonuclease HI